MAMYYVLLLLPLFYGVLCEVITTKKSNKLMIKIFFGIFLFMLCLRSKYIGIDLLNYEYYFRRYSQMDFNGLIKVLMYPESVDVEPGYIFFNYTLGAVTENFQWLLIVVALISVLPICKLYQQNSRFAYLSICLFVCTGLFPIYFSALRQIIAVTLGVLAYVCLIEKNHNRFFLYVLLAVLFHKSAVLVLLMYPLKFIKITKKASWFLLGCLMVVFTFIDKIYLFAAQLYGNVGYMTITKTGSYNMLIFFTFLFLVCLFLCDEEKMDDELYLLRNIMFLIVIIQSFSSISTVAMRLNYYFIVFIPYLFPKLLSIFESEYRIFGRLLYLALCAFLTFYYFVNMYFGADILQIYPYEFCNI